LLNTDYYIAFIPHVFWSHNNDLDFLLELKKHFINNPRVLLFVENRSDKIKGIISQCRFFIGARTHSVIAAYSSMIPTLAIGYSVKAIGIAKDIFGSSDNYVIPINEISNNQVLINKFDWIIKNEKIIRTHLNNFMPGYIQKTYKIIEIINNLNKNV
jgi:polysaccharide pyruvyl transferase WcaK-like protein